MICIFSLAMACLSCRQATVPSTEAGGPPTRDTMDLVPPIPDADPSVRHPVQARVPAGLRLERTRNRLVVSIGPAQSTNLTVGARMVTGTESEIHIFRDGVPVESKPWHQSGSLGTGLSFEPYQFTFTTARDGMPQPGGDYTVEYRRTIFETDLPAQHFWSPRSGKHYRVLWSQTFKETVK